MEDISNRELAEKELKDQFGLENYVETATPQQNYDNLVELPQSAAADSAQGPSVVNNINVSVSKEEKSTESPPRRQVFNIVNNALQNITNAANEDDVKKNYNMSSSESNGNQDSNNIIPNILNDDNSGLEREVQDPIEFINNIEDIILPDVEESPATQEQSAEIRVPTYSVSSVADKEPISSRINFVKNITENIVNMANENPEVVMNSTVLKMSSYNTTNATFDNDVKNSLYETYLNTSNMMNSEMYQDQMESDDQRSIESKSVSNPNTIPGANQAGLNQQQLDGSLSQSRNPHRRPNFSSMYGMLAEMNSPPNWRTVLG